MTDEELMQQALEALEFGLHVGFDESSESQIKKGGKAFDQHGRAISALRERLAQPEQKHVIDCPRCGHCCPSQPEQEPVAWMHPDWRTYTRAPAVSITPKDGWHPLYTAQQPQMQPCAGRNCGSTNPNLHSADCFEDYENATGMAQPTQPEPVSLEVAVGAAYKTGWEHGKAVEREACAKLCESYRDEWFKGLGRYEFMGEGADFLADFIRARGKS